MTPILCLSAFSFFFPLICDSKYHIITSTTVMAITRASSDTMWMKSWYWQKSSDQPLFKRKQGSPIIKSLKYTSKMNFMSYPNITILSNPAHPIRCGLIRIFIFLFELKSQFIRFWELEVGEWWRKINSLHWTFYEWGDVSNRNLS